MDNAVDRMTDVINLLVGAIPGVRMTAQEINTTAVVWARLFALYPPELVERAALKTLEGHGYNSLPAPAKVLDSLKALQCEAEPDTVSAWSEVQYAIDNRGRYDESGALASMSPRTAYVVKRMGWQSICDTESDKTGVLFAQFERCYKESKVHTPDCRKLPLSARPGLTRLQAVKVMQAIDVPAVKQALDGAEGSEER